MSGFDAVQINDTALMSNIDVSDHPVDSGTAFTYYNVYGGIIAQTSILCSWNSVWYPNSGEKYKGFRRINAPGDTTYGWIKYNFVGNAASCSDTVYGIELAYSSVSNIHLYAGEGIITGVSEVGNGNTLEILPTITTDNIQITNHSTMKQTVSLFNSVGQLKRTIFINSNTTIQLDIANLKKGIYFLRTTETNRPTRIVKL